jgi:CRP-like cAMP-binding protein
MAGEGDVVPGYEDSHARVGNRLLDALPPGELGRLRPHMEAVRLEQREPVYEAGTPIEHVYFPTTGVFSLVTTMRNGSVVEVGTVGNEGMLGLQAFLDGAVMPVAAFSQVAGDSLRMDTDAFKREVGAGSRLHALLQGYTLAMLAFTAQSSACNALHPVRQRCARWMLLTHDRVGTDEFPLTHGFLSQMLGVRRASVTEVAGSLQKQGLISYRHGRLAVADRAGLEASSCECYAVIRAEFDRLLG